MKIIDCFCFLNEISLLEIRLNELKDTVDCFVIVEANLTGSGIEKGFIFEENQYKFKDFPILYIKHTIDKTIASDYEERHNRMYQQRHGFQIGVAGLNLANDDLIIMSDLDEIPRGNVIRDLKSGIIPIQHNSFLTLVLRGSFYYVNTKFMSPESHVWFPCPVISTRKTFVNTDLKWMRHNKDHFPHINNAGWHFSHLGSPEVLQQKMLASSHTEYCGEKFTSIENIARRRNLLADPYDRGYDIKRFDLDDDYPQYLLDNKEKFSEFIL